MWRSRVSYSLKAAALATGTLLVTPYLFMYDMMVLTIPVAFLVRIGLKRGFRQYEVFALGCAVALVLGFILTGAPVGLGATLIVATLIMRRAMSARHGPLPCWCPVSSDRARLVARPRRAQPKRSPAVTAALQAPASCGIETTPREHADLLDAASVGQGLDGQRHQVAA